MLSATVSAVFFLAWAVLCLAFVVLAVMVLLTSHKKNQAEIRVIRLRLGLGENAVPGERKGK